MKILTVKYIGDYKLEFVFSNQIKKIADFENFLKTSMNKSISKFLDKNLFKQVLVDSGFLSWNDGEMEISAKSVYEKYAKSLKMVSDENK